MPAKKQTLSNELLDHVLANASFTSPTSVHAALYTAAETATAQGTEVSGGAYNRVLITFGTPAAAGVIANTAIITFPTASAAWGTVTDCAICDSITPGTDDAFYFGPLTASKVVGNGDDVSFAIGALTVTEQ